MTDKIQSTISNDPTMFTIRVSTPGLLRWIGIRKVKFGIRGAYYGTLLKIAPLLQNLKIEAGEETGYINAALKGMSDNIPLQARIISIAILNGPARIKLFAGPLAWFIRWNLDAPSMLKLVSIVVDRMNIADFMNSIVLTGGLRVIKSQTSPSDTGEMIAPGGQSDK